MLRETLPNQKAKLSLHGWKKHRSFCLPVFTEDHLSSASLIPNHHLASRRRDPRKTTTSSKLWLCPIPPSIQRCHVVNHSVPGNTCKTGSTMGWWIWQSGRTIQWSCWIINTNMDTRFTSPYSLVVVSRLPQKNCLFCGRIIKTLCWSLSRRYDSFLIHGAMVDPTCFPNYLPKWLLSTSIQFF